MNYSFLTLGNRCSMGMADGGGVFFFLCLPLRPKELDLRRPLVISELGVVGLEGEQIC